MLSAAAGALLAAALAAVLPARADVTITTATSTPLSTAGSGNITINASGSVGISQTSIPAVTINSHHSVINNGFIANTNAGGAVGLLIDTSGGSWFAPSGFGATGGIDLGGSGTGKRGILISGGNTFYGPITLTNLTATAASGANTVTQQSSLILQGDASAAFFLTQGTKITSNVLLGGGGISQISTVNSTASNSVIVDLDGTVNGNFIIQSGINGVGGGVIGVEVLGGIHSCASDTNKPSGFTCPSLSGGSFVNAGAISLIGTQRFNTRGGNPQAGSAIIIGGSIDGGFLSTGPATSNNIAASSISSAGVVLPGVTQPVVLLDPSQSITGSLTAPRGPVVLGPVTADVDTISPGYSFINRGSIQAQPIDGDVSTAAMIIQGSSPTYFTCLSSIAVTCSTTPTARTDTVTTTVNGVSTTTPVTYTATGGILNTGSIDAVAGTNTQTVGNSGVTTATALYIGPYTFVPRLDVVSQAINGNNNTPGSISATVSGIGQGSAFGVVLGPNANVPVINIGKGASITAQVITNTVSPTRTIAPTSSPFSLVSQAIIDQSGTLKTINNAGTIQAFNTILSPATGAATSSITNAIDLSTGTGGGVTVNNSGRILGSVLLASAGNGITLNVGNTGINGTANPAITPAIVNTTTNYAVVGQSLQIDTSGLPPISSPTRIDFGSGSGHFLHVGGFGYVNAVINSGVNSLAVQVDPNGLLYVANTTTPLQATTFNIATNGTLGLAISQANLNSLNPVVQANSANLSGANLALQFGTYISSGFTAATTTSPTVQNITLIRAPVIIDTTIGTQNALLGQNTPFLFETPAESGVTPLTNTIDASGQQVLQLHLLPRSTNARNADGTPGLNLSGNARNQFPFAASALATDNELGSAIATSLTVYNTPGVAASGINVLASQQQAQQVFSQFAPDVSGGTREIAIMITDQASGPVAARQRLLRSYGNQAGDTTLWGAEFTGQIANKGRTSADGTITSYKDHGFGFVLGVDGGSARNGWFGGAFTFYSGDVTQQLPRATRTNTQWYMLTGYTDWRGKNIFVDTQISAAYGNFSQTRDLNIGGLLRQASSRRPGAMVALGVNAGTMLRYSGIDIDPHVSLDGLTLREEGFLETNGGPGLNLDVAPYFASSLRGAIGADLRKTVTIWDFQLSPELRVGYRYDVLQQAVKINAAFQSTGGRSTAGNTMTFIGPDPDTGNTILGLGLGAGTDTWHLGVSYDWIRGNNGSTTQVGILSVLGRI